MNNELLNECKVGEMLRGINVIHTHAQSSVSINQLTPSVQTSTIEEDHKFITLKLSKNMSL
jgi:hypothetical protein